MLGKVVELVKARDGKTRGAKLLTVSISGLQQNCYRPVQKFVPFEIVKKNKVNSNENHDEGHLTMNGQPEELQLKESS